jgi:hypothetical protein
MFRVPNMQLSPWALAIHGILSNQPLRGNWGNLPTQMKDRAATTTLWLLRCFLPVPFSQSRLSLRLQRQMSAATEVAPVQQPSHPAAAGWLGLGLLFQILLRIIRSSWAQLLSFVRLRHRLLPVTASPELAFVQLPPEAPADASPPPLRRLMVRTSMPSACWAREMMVTLVVWTFGGPRISWKLELYMGLFVIRLVATVHSWPPLP